MPVNRVLETILLAIVAGGASGTIAAFIVTPTRTIVRDITTVTSTVAVATSTESAEPSLVRLEPEIPKPLIPRRSCLDARARFFRCTANPAERCRKTVRFRKIANLGKLSL